MPNRKVRKETRDLRPKSRIARFARKLVIYAVTVKHACLGIPNTHSPIPKSRIARFARKLVIYPAKVKHCCPGIPNTRSPIPKSRIAIYIYIYINVCVKIHSYIYIYISRITRITRITRIHFPIPKSRIARFARKLVIPDRNQGLQGSQENL